MTTPSSTSWDSSHSYEQYVGRWSRQVASLFLDWLALPPALSWSDVGCGTGALASAILTRSAPDAVYGIDYSSRFISHARERLGDNKVHLLIGDATHLPLNASTCDVAVSGLVLNFVSDPDHMVPEMKRITKPGGWVAIYVWDYARGMQMMRYFWEAAISVTPDVARFDQAEVFPLCQPEPLQALFERNQLRSVNVQALEIPTVFKDFDDYWRPFLGGTGPAPSYLASVSDDVRERIRLILEARLASVPGRPIELSARTWAVRGSV